MAKLPFGRKPTRTKSGSQATDPTSPPTELSAINFDSPPSVALAGYADMVQVSNAASGLGAAYEEAAVLYANGNVREAEAILQAALDNQAGTAGEGLWMMLLDLYRLTGQQESFESRVIDYATRFERSPPPWHNLSTRQVRTRSSATPLLHLAGTLNAQVAEQLRQARIIAERGRQLRLDLNRLRGFDDEGCKLLYVALREFKRERVAVWLVNAGPFAEMLATKLEVGVAEHQHAWLLLLEILLHLGDVERFENLAVDYAITFEESPPSWENTAPPPQQEADAAAEEETEEEDTGLRLEGEIVGANHDAIRAVTAALADLEQATIDCSQLRRMDFVNAGMLFNIVTSLNAQGKRIRLAGVNTMVAALLKVMGVDQVAQINLRT